MEILAIDVGNTSVLFGHFKGAKLKKTFRISTQNFVGARSSRPGRGNLAPTVGRIRKIIPLKNVDAAVIASVVPEAGQRLKKIFSQKFKIKTYLIGRDLQAPILNRYRDPKQVGIDRLVNAVAAYHKTRKEAIVIDFGTAITFDVISKKGEYLGGVIAPGIELSLEALFQKTALLPKIRLAHPKRVVGKDTVESIRAGCSVGIGGLCDRVVSEITRAQNFKPVVIATGGYAKFMSRYCKNIQAIDPHLTLKGIRLTYLARTLTFSQIGPCPPAPRHLA